MVIAESSVTPDAIRAAPTVANGMVYIAATDSTVYAFSTNDLSFQSEAELSGATILGSPVVTDETVYAADTDGTVVAFDLSLTTLNTTTVDGAVTAPLTMAGETLSVTTDDRVRSFTTDLVAVDELSPQSTVQTSLVASRGVGYVGTAAASSQSGHCATGGQLVQRRSLFRRTVRRSPARSA